MTNKLLEYRQKKGLSLRQLAPEIGVSHQTLSNWEKGVCPPNVDKLKLLAIYGDADLRELANELLSIYTA